MRVALLDGYNLMHRARFGMQQGDYHIVFNFFRSLRPIIAEIKPDLVYLVLEGMPVHRIAADSEYKANRVVEEGTKQAADMAEFRRQKKIILQALESFPITLAKHPELECDDTIGSLCLDVHANDDCFVVSTDTDFIQLLDETQRIRLYNPVRKEYLAHTPYDYVTWKSLRGDKTDNIMRVGDITDKKAEKILANPALLESIKHDPVLGPQFTRNLELVKFKTGDHAGIQFSSPKPDFDAARSLFREFKFFAMINDTAWRNYTKTFKNLLDNAQE
jgi:5'-3' exonuclease